MKELAPQVTREFAVRFGAGTGSLRFLGGGQDWSDGILYEFVPGERSGNAADAPRVIKLLSFPREDRLALDRAIERVEFMHRLSEGGARVIAPLPSEAGRLFETLEAAGGLHLAYCYRKVPGRPAQEGDPCVGSGGFFRAMGDCLGRMHAVAESRAEILDPAGTSSASRLLGGWREEGELFRGWCRDDEVGLAWDRLRDALAALPVDKSGYGLVHNDAHVGNFLLDPGTKGEPAVAGGNDEPVLTVLDFDVANYHFFMNDSAAALYSFGIMSAGGIETATEASRELLDRAIHQFWTGYRRHREPGRDWLERLELFWQYRRCLLFMPFQEAMAGDPDWKARWKARIAAADQRLFG